MRGIHHTTKTANMEKVISSVVFSQCHYVPR